MPRLRALLVLVLVSLGAAAAVAIGQPAGHWVAPVDPVVVRQGFDPPEQRWNAGHRGVDLAGDIGQLVHAAGGGEVIFAGDLAGRGVVSVRHGELRTTYEPVDATVSVGDLVDAGDVIGLLEPGHRSSGPVLDQALLHWGLLRGDTYLDPMSLLGPVRVRLLPRWHLPLPPRAPAPSDGARPSRRPTSTAPRGDAPPPKTRPGAGSVAAAGLVAAAGVGFAAAARRGR